MRYHLVGILGSGMSALAQFLRDRGYNVSGSDRRLEGGTMPPAGQALGHSGVSFFPQDGSGVSGASTVVTSSAVEQGNPDLIAAEFSGVRVMHRAHCLARLAADRTMVAVTGTSGKTTVTAMAGWILEQAGMDPVVINGGVLSPWSGRERIGNVRNGSGSLCVLEADESDRSLLEFAPDYAVITNASPDHFSERETNALFDRFAGQVHCDVIDGRRHLPPAEDMLLTAGGSEFRYGGSRFTLACPGTHNVRNALTAVCLCEVLGVAPQTSAAALKSFPGVRRRLEVVGSGCGVTVIDDFAHNPAKIEAAWSAVAPYCSRVLAVWRPHGFGPLRAMYEELVETFSSLCRDEDQLYLLPVYYAGGTAGGEQDSDVLADGLKERGVTARFIEFSDELESTVAGACRDGDAVLVMGARDPGLSGLARRILSALHGV
jgi:UDP-N-acetylmuramate--alanine ligase